MTISIFQINYERDRNCVAYLAYDSLERLQGTYEIECEIYDRVFAGEVVCRDIEGIYRIFNLTPPEGYCGRLLSVSDVVGIKDDDGGTAYYYCDSFGFRRVDFTPISEDEQNGD